MLKKCLDLLLSIITSIINLYLRLGYFHITWKCALVIPLLKKFGLDLIFKNFRPVSNLPYLSKLVESAVVTQLRDQNECNGLIPSHASSYRKYHSTETALLKVQSDMFESMDSQNVTLLVLLDLSAAFGSVSYSVLFSALEGQFGTSGTVLKWFKPYLDVRQEKVLVKDVCSEPNNFTCGVPPRQLPCAHTLCYVH